MIMLDQQKHATDFALLLDGPSQQVLTSAVHENSIVLKTCTCPNKLNDQPFVFYSPLSLCNYLSNIKYIKIFVCISGIRSEVLQQSPEQEYMQ